MTGPTDVPELDEDTAGEILLPDPEPGGTQDAASLPPRLVGAVLAVTLGILAVGVLANRGLSGLLYTPERALTKLEQALEREDLRAARRLVDPSAWPASRTDAPTGLAELLQSPALQGGAIEWERRDDAHAVVRWARPTALEAVDHDAFVELRRDDGRWMVSNFQYGWADDTTEVFSVIDEMQEAAARRDAASFLGHAEPGKDTCTAKTCPVVIRAIEKGQPHLFVEAIEMTDMVEGSLRAVEAGGEVTLRWLRKTEYLDQVGVVEVHARRVDGRWKVSTIDARHFAEMNEEMDVWTANHGELLWRGKLKDLVEVGSRTPFCEEYNWLGQCAVTVHPSFVRNLGGRAIRRIKISKNRSGRRFNDASQTLWGVYANIAPGKIADDPVDWSQPVYNQADDTRAFSFYRVDYIEFEDAERMEYQARDFREEAPGGLTFEMVQETRTAAGSSVEDHVALQQQLHDDYGYSPDEVSRLLGHLEELAASESPLRR